MKITARGGKNVSSFFWLYFLGYILWKCFIPVETAQRGEWRGRAAALIFSIPAQAFSVFF